MPSKAKNRGTRRPRQEDAPRVLDLMRACDIADFGEHDTDLQDLLYDWSLTDLTRDATIVEDASGEVIAYTALITQLPVLRLDLYLDPQGRADNLRESLFSALEERGAEKLRTEPAAEGGYLMAHLAHSNEHDRAFFEAAGYRSRMYYFQMRHMQDTPPSLVEWPEGIMVRSFGPGEDDQAVYEFVQEAFYRPDRDPPTLDAWREFMMRPDSFLPELWKLAFLGEQLVGTCFSFDYEEEGWVRQLAVAEDLRRQGLGSALLRDAFRVFFERGQPRVALSVASDNPNAVNFYKRLGMTLVRQYDEYIKPDDDFS